MHSRGGFVKTKRVVVSLGLVLIAAFAARASLAALHHWGSAPVAAPAYSPGLGEKGEGLEGIEAYWNDRITYPTGKFNPAWIRKAAAEDARVERAVPAGHKRGEKTGGKASAADGAGTTGTAAGTTAGGDLSTAGTGGTAAATLLDTTSFTSLGPRPLRMTGCSGCFNYTTTEGRVNAVVIDPTTTTNGSIVAYAASVGGGVWKTTNCCAQATTTWNVVSDDPLISAISIDTLTIDPNDHNTI